MADDAQDRTTGLFPACPRSWGFPESSTAELARRLALAGEGATLAVVPYVKGPLLLLRLRVIPKGDGERNVNVSYETTALADINDSFPCPPWTGCGGGD